MAKKKPNAKKLARVLDKAHDRARKTGNIKRIQSIAKGIKNNRAYTKDLVNEATKQSSHFLTYGGRQTRDDLIKNLTRDTATKVRFDHKKRVLRKEFSPSKPISKHQPLKSIGAKIINNPITRRAVNALPFIGVAALTYEVATSGAHTAKRVNRDLALNKRQNAQRKERVKHDRGNLFQRMLDFDVVEYVRGDYNIAPKTKEEKVRSVQGELTAAEQNSKKQNSKKFGPKRKPMSVEKRAGRTFKRTRVVNGKRINETVRNYRYGK